MTVTHISNINIKSNVQVIATPLPFNDANYLSNIFEKQALEKFPKHVGLTALQKEMKMEGTPCSYSDNKIVTPGVILKNGKYYAVIRCPKLSTCKYSGPKHGNCDMPREILYRKP